MGILLVYDVTDESSFNSKSKTLLCVSLILFDIDANTYWHTYITQLEVFFSGVLMLDDQTSKGLPINIFILCETLLAGFPLIFGAQFVVLFFCTLPCVRGVNGVHNYYYFSLWFVSRNNLASHCVQTLGTGFATLSSMLLTMSTRYW